MRRSFFFALCWVALLFSLPSHTALAANDKISQTELTAQKELLQTQIEALKSLQQKDADAINKRIDDQLAQVGQGVDRFGVIASVLGTLITVLLVLGGFIGYRNAKSEAKEVAEASARNWVHENSAALLMEIEELKEKAIHGKQEITDHVSGFLVASEEAHKSIKAAIDTVQEYTTSGTIAPDTPEKAKAISEIKAYAEQLKTKNEDTFSFDDWNARAHAALSEQKPEDAAYFWLKASQHADANEVQVARALFNRGAAQGQLGQSEEEIKTYDEVLRRFGDASAVALKEVVAKALVNKGATIGQLGQSEEAIKTCNELLRRFGDASELALKEQVATALVNKGVAQEKLEKSEEAIKTYDEVLHRFGDASELALKEWVANALVNKGVTQGQLGQNEEAIKTYDEVLRRFGDASELALKELVARALNSMGFSSLTLAKAQWADRDAANALLHKAQDLLSQAITKMPQSFGMALGNRAYAHWLLGNLTEAETDFAAGLRAEKFARQVLYEATLKDFDIHPIPEDQGMREMVERLWVAYQHGKTGEGNHG